MNVKRILFITLGVLLAIALVGLGVWFRARNVSTSPPDEPSGGGLPSGSLPTGSGSQTVGASSTLAQSMSLALTQGEIVDYAVNSSGELLTIRPDGQITRSSTTDVLVNSVKVSGLIDARFSTDGRKVLARSGDPNSPRWSVYDLSRNAWRQLDLAARDAAWAPSSQEIAYGGRRLTGTTISIWDLASDRSRPRAVGSLAAEDLEVRWLSSADLLVGERGSARVQTSLWIVDARSGAFALLKDDVRGPLYKPDGRGKGILFLSNGATGGSLSLVGNEGEELERFSFLTLPSKCAFYRAISTSTPAGREMLACATPRDPRILADVELPDAYEKKIVFTTDNIFSIDLTSGVFAPILESPSTAFDAINLKVYGSDLYFINRYDSRLYRVPLAG